MMTYYDIEDERSEARRRGISRKKKHEKSCNVQKDTYGYCTCKIGNNELLKKGKKK